MIGSLIECFNAMTRLPRRASRFLILGDGSFLGMKIQYASKSMDRRKERGLPALNEVKARLLSSGR